MEKSENIDELIAKHTRLTNDHKKLSNNVSTVNSELLVRKNELKRLMAEIREAGLDPNNLGSEVRRLREVLTVKLNNFESELKDANKIIDPMIREINNV